VRRRFEERFSVSRMARDYVKVYETLIGMPGARVDEAATPVLAATRNGAGDVAH
jgi:hypothetical protein